MKDILKLLNLTKRHWMFNFWWLSKQVHKICLCSFMQVSILWHVVVNLFSLFLQILNFANHRGVFQINMILLGSVSWWSRNDVCYPQSWVGMPFERIPQWTERRTELLNVMCDILFDSPLLRRCYCYFVEVWIARIE